MVTNNLDLFLTNINNQSKTEWNIYEKSVDFLSQNEHGKKYLILFELIQRTCSLSILQKSILSSEDHKTIAFIGARIFNDGMMIFRTGMSGYYQVSMSIIRDLIEIQFLLDFFRTHPEKIKEWREAKNKERYIKFAPNILYKKLDLRDGYTEEKRKTTYQMFCEYAGHVSYPGIKLTTNDKGEVLIGPFFDEKKLLNTSLEMVRRLGYAVISLIALLPNTEILPVQSQLELMEYMGKVLNLDIINQQSYKNAKNNIEQLLHQTISPK